MTAKLLVPPFEFPLFAEAWLHVSVLRILQILVQFDGEIWSTEALHMTLVHPVNGFTPLTSCKCEILAGKELDFVLKADRCQWYRKAALKHFPYRLASGGCSSKPQRSVLFCRYSKNKRQEYNIKGLLGNKGLKSSGPKKECSLLGWAKQRRTRQQDQQSGWHTRGVQISPLCTVKLCCYWIHSIGKLRGNINCEKSVWTLKAIFCSPLFTHHNRLVERYFQLFVMLYWATRWQHVVNITAVARTNPNR